MTDAVITVPAYFNDAQRQATTGRQDRRPLNVAYQRAGPRGALHMASTRRRTRRSPHDFGGGTFDISVLEVGDGVVEVKATNGDTHLGGDDIDDRIIQWLVAEFKKSEGIDLLRSHGAPAPEGKRGEGQDRSSRRRWRPRSTCCSSPVDATGPKHLQLKLTRAPAESPDDLLQRTMGPVKQALADAGGVDPTTKIDEVVLVGRIDAHAEGRAAREGLFRQGAAQGRQPG